MEEEQKRFELAKYKNNREYRMAFKLKVLDDLVSNQESYSFIERKHGISNGGLRYFRETVLQDLGYYRILEEMKKRVEPNSENNSQQEIAALKKALELANLKVAALETLIEVAEDQFNIDIRKKQKPKQSK